MIVIAVKRFKDFIKLVGPDDSRDKSGMPGYPNRQCRFATAPLLLDLANT